MQASLPAPDGRPRPAVVSVKTARPVQKPPPGEDARREQTGCLLYEFFGDGTIRVSPRNVRILLLTPRLPWPPIDGGRIAMGRLAEGLLHAGADVEILSLNPRKHRADVVAAPVPIEAIDIDTSRIVWSRDAPLIIGRFVSPEFREAIRDALRRFRPDIVQIESPFLMPYVDVVRAESSARVVLRSLNVEFRIWEGLAANERNPLRRFAFRRVAASLRTYEVRHLNTPDAVISISADDAEVPRNDEVPKNGRDRSREQRFGEPHDLLHQRPVHQFTQAAVVIVYVE